MFIRGVWATSDFCCAAVPRCVGIVPAARCLPAVSRGRWKGHACLLSSLVIRQLGLLVHDGQVESVQCP